MYKYKPVLWLAFGYSVSEEMSVIYFASMYRQFSLQTFNGVVLSDGTGSRDLYFLNVEF